MFDAGPGNFDWFSCLPLYPSPCNPTVRHALLVRSGTIRSPTCALPLRSQLWLFRSRADSRLQQNRCTAASAGGTTPAEVGVVTVQRDVGLITELPGR